MRGQAMSAQPGVSVSSRNSAEYPLGRLLHWRKSGQLGRRRGRGCGSLALSRTCLQQAGMGAPSGCNRVQHSSASGSRTSRHSREASTNIRQIIMTLTLLLANSGQSEDSWRMTAGISGVLSKTMHSPNRRGAGRSSRNTQCQSLETAGYYG